MSAVTLAALGLWGSGLWSSGAVAQSLPRRAIDRAIASSVLVRCETPNGRSEGSGSIIDDNGYVLTNFHVVGHTHPFDGGVPGELFRQDGVVTLWNTTSSRQEARPTWVGRVVRAAPSLDLALIRIDTTIDGAPIARGSLTSIPLQTSPGELSDRVFAVGYPSGMRSVSLTGGQVTGYDLDAEGVPTFIRVDAEFNPGNSGGGLLNAAGELIGVPTQVSRSRQQISPIEKARPISRVPAAWLTDMARGITDFGSTVAPRLSPAPLQLESTGAGFVVGGEELFFLRVTPGFRGSVHFEAGEGAPMVQAALISLEQPRQVLRAAQNNTLPITPADGQQLVVVLTVARTSDDGSQRAAASVVVRAVEENNVFIQPQTQAQNQVQPQVQPQAPVAPTITPTYQPPYSPGVAPQAGVVPPRVRRSSFYVGAALLFDSLDPDGSVGGGGLRLQYMIRLFGTNPEAVVRFNLEGGIRLLAGKWRSEGLFYFHGALGGRLSFGSADLALEVPFAFTLGYGQAEGVTAVSPYGYDIGAYLRIRAIGFGLNYMEAQRGEYTVLRSLSAGIRLEF